MDLEVIPERSDEKMPVCPKCGYKAISTHDPLLTAHNGMGEYPKCGIIVKKYISSSKEKNNDKTTHQLRMMAQIQNPIPKE